MGLTNDDIDSFSSILKEKLDKSSQADETPRPKVSPTAFYSSESLWEKLTDLGLSKISIARPSLYKVSTQQESIRWKPTGFSAELTLAFEFFHQHGEVRVTDKSTARELKGAYRRLAKSLHPDAHALSSELEQKFQAKLFRELQTHYACLTALSKSRAA